MRGLQLPWIIDQATVPTGVKQMMPRYAKHLGSAVPLTPVAAFMALQPFSVLRISAGLGKRQQQEKLNNGGHCDFQTGALPDLQPWKGCRQIKLVSSARS